MFALFALRLLQRLKSLPLTATASAIGYLKSDNNLGFRPDSDVEFDHLHQIEKAPEKAGVLDALESLDLAFLG